MFYRIMKCLMGENIPKNELKRLIVGLIAAIVAFFALLLKSDVLGLILQVILIFNLAVSYYIDQTIKRRDEKIEREKEKGDLHAMLCPVCQHWTYYDEKEKRLK